MTRAHPNFYFESAGEPCSADPAAASSPCSARCSGRRAGLSREHLLDILRFDLSTGIFIWVPGQRRSDGRLHPKRRGIAGTKDGDGYIVIRIDGIDHFSHRLAWLCAYGAWPADQIDHINLDRADNRISNLRAASRIENQHNRGVKINNSTGAKGVSPKFGKNGHIRYQSSIQANGKRFSLGTFDTVSDAASAYAKAAVELHGEFARVTA